MKIKKIHKTMNPKDKFLESGFENLTEIEILAIIINTGTQKNNAIEIATHLITKYLSVANIASLSVNELCSNHGIGANKAIRIICALNIHKFWKNPKILNSFDEIKNYTSKIYLENNVEVVTMLILNSSFELKYKLKMTSLKQESVTLSIKQIVAVCYKYNAFSVVMIHNHPNNDTNFSMQDKMMYIRVKKEFEKFEIKLIDFILYTDTKIINNLSI